MSRATRLRAHRTPYSRSSAWTRGAPYVPPAVRVDRLDLYQEGGIGLGAGLTIEQGSGAADMREQGICGHLVNKCFVNNVLHRAEAI